MKIKVKVKIFGLLASIFFLGTISNAEIIKLKGGYLIKGKILKRDHSKVIIDLGFDLIKIPGAEILTINKDNVFDNPAKVDNSKLYTAREMEQISTEEGVKTFAPSVVLVRTPHGLGSGFIVNKKGYIITNFHVIRGQKHIYVKRYKRTDTELKQITHKKVRIVALDPFHDLAVLQIEDDISKEIDPGIFSPNGRVATGEKIFVIGNPLGLERTVTEGVISHPGRNFAGKVFLQIDASVNPGNSGGPLFNSYGQIIGVINMGARAMQGLNFAIPIRHVKFLLNNIDSFAYNESNSQSGYFYLPAPSNPQKKK